MVKHKNGLISANSGRQLAGNRSELGGGLRREARGPRLKNSIRLENLEQRANARGELICCGRPFFGTAEYIAGHLGFDRET